MFNLLIIPCMIYRSSYYFNLVVGPLIFCAQDDQVWHVHMNPCKLVQLRETHTIKQQLNLSSQDNWNPILPFFFLHDHQTPSLYSLLSKRLRRAFWYPLIIAIRHLKNQKDLLVQATLTSTPSELPGNYPCGASRCKTCPILRVTNEFSSHTTGKSFKVKFRASCKSSKNFYLITCRRCGLQYVGETSQPLHARISGHWSDIAHWRTDASPVTEHFNSGAHWVSDMTVMVIELSTSHDPCLWKVKEARWIRTRRHRFLPEWISGLTTCDTWTFQLPCSFGSRVHSSHSQHCHSRKITR